MLLVCIFSIIILGIIIVKRPRTIIWMGRYIRNKLLLFIIYIYARTHTNRVTPPCLGTKGSQSPAITPFHLFEIGSFRLCLK